MPAAPPLRQITYSAISDELRDKQRFPAVLRTVPGAHHQVEAMVQLMLHFRWNWIIVLASRDDYGRENSQLLSERLARSRVCIAFQEALPTPQPDQVVTGQERRHLKAIVDKLQRSSARVVVVFSRDLALRNFFREVLSRNFTGVVWIASESWAIDPVLHNVTELRHTGTFLGITTQSVPIPGFSEFRVHHAQARPPVSNRTSSGATCNQECDTCLDATASFDTILTLSGERMVYNVYSAVYAVAHALHSLLRCSQTHCPKRVVYPWQVRKARAPCSKLRACSCHGDHSLPLPCRPICSALASLPLGGVWASRWERPWEMPCLQSHRARVLYGAQTNAFFSLNYPDHSRQSVLGISGEIPSEEAPVPPTASPGSAGVGWGAGEWVWGLPSALQDSHLLQG